MNYNYNKLQRIFNRGILTPDMFYSITVTKYNISLKGHFSTGLILALQKTSDCVISHSAAGYLEYEKYNIKITITD